MSELYDMSACQMRQEIGAGRLSAREVTHAHLARIEQCNPAVNALVHVDAQRALAHAAAADEAQARGEPLGLLHGLPVAHKDCFHVTGMPTTQGSPLYRDFMPAAESLIVQRQRAAGAIALGKTNVPEFCAGSHTYNTVFGLTHNPHAPGKSAGGSSGGSAAALACGMAALADGTDMGGSLRNPASFCGVVGLRPSPGRVPQWPVADPFNPLTVAGPMGRTVADVALLLAAIAGPDARDPWSIEQDPRRFLDPLSRDWRGTRVAYAPDWGGLPVDDEVRQAIAGALPVLDGLGVETTAACPDFSGANSAFQVLRGVAFELSLGETRRRHPDQVKQSVHWNVDMGHAQRGADLAAAQRDRALLYQRMLDFMGDHEFLIGPVSQVAPFDGALDAVEVIAGQAMENYIHWMRSAYYVTLTGHPAISVPCGHTPDGRPVGLQIVGRYRQEFALLQFAQAFEMATRHARRRPSTLFP